MRPAISGADAAEMTRPAISGVAVAPTMAPATSGADAAPTMAPATFAANITKKTITVGTITAAAITVAMVAAITVATAAAIMVVTTAAVTVVTAATTDPLGRIQPGGTGVPRGARFRLAGRSSDHGPQTGKATGDRRMLWRGRTIVTTTRKASTGRGTARAWAASLALLLVWACAVPSNGPLSILSPVAPALADKGSGGGGSGGGGSGGGGSGGGGGDHSGSGGGGDSDSGGGGGDNSGKGKDGDDKKGSETDKAEKRDMQRFLDRLKHGGSVAYARVSDAGVEVRYSDGWSEAVSRGRYRLVDGRQRVVADRPARKSDLSRLSAAAATQ